MKMRWLIGVAAAGGMVVAAALGCSPAQKTEPSPTAPVPAPSASAPSSAPATPIAGQTPPRIEVATQKYDMGVVSGEGLAKGSVAIYNKGGQPLSVTQVSTSCGCTTGTIEQKVIPPGGEAPMTVVVNPGKIHGFESSKLLTIYSNDPEKPRVNVEVTVKVKPEFLLEPGQLDFGKVAKGETASGRIIFRQAEDAPVVLNGVKAWGTPPGLNLAFAKRPENEWAQAGRAEYAIDVTVDTNEVPPGPYKAMVGLETSVKRVSRYSYTITADVVAPYSVKPRPLSLGLVNPGKAPAGAIVVAADQPLSVEDVAITGTDLSATPRPAEDGKSMAIDVAVSPEASSGSKREQLSFTVKVGEAAFKERVPVAGVVAHRQPAQVPGQAP